MHLANLGDYTFVKKKNIGKFESKFKYSVLSYIAATLTIPTNRPLAVTGPPDPFENKKKMIL